MHGLRVTDKPTVEVVEMVLAGAINKEIVSAINRQGGKAVGICGKDANLMIAKKITEMPDPEINLMKAVDIGYVGDPIEVNPHIVDVISKSDLIPVIAPIGVSRDGQTLNINADTFASALAARMKAKRLLLLTDVAGVLDKDKKLIQRAHRRRGARADPRRHHHRRHDPQDRGLHRGGRGRRRSRRHHRRPRAALRAARTVHRARRRHDGERAQASQDQGLIAATGVRRMPTYQYECKRCGVFNATRPMAEFDRPQPCPECSRSSDRAFGIAPGIATGGSDARTREGSGKLNLGSHRGGCSCCTTSKRRGV